MRDTTTGGMTAAQLSRRGRLGALTRLSRESTSTMTAAACQANKDIFERRVDPDGVLAPEERRRRAAAARTAHMLKLGILSGRARREKTAKGGR